MAQPELEVDDEAQKIDTLYSPDGEKGIKIGIGSVTFGGGLTPKGKYHGVATQLGGDSYTATSPIVTSGVRDSAGVLAAAYGSAALHKTVSAATTNATVVKASAGKVFSIVANNQNAAVRYLKLYNKATAPTVGTDVPVATIALQPVSTREIALPKGWEFSTGIAFALTTEATDAGSTAVAANEHVINISYV